MQTMMSSKSACFESNASSTRQPFLESEESEEFRLRSLQENATTFSSAVACRERVPRSAIETSDKFFLSSPLILFVLRGKLFSRLEFQKGKQESNGSATLRNRDR